MNKNLKRRKKTDLRREGLNHLFEEWILEWKEKAGKGSRLYFVYGKALDSLKKFPLPVRKGKDCEILEFFGPTICKMLDKRLEQHVNDGGVVPSMSDTKLLDDCEPGPSSIPKQRVRKNPTSKPKRYIPAFRSGPYALLVTLIQNEEQPNYRGYMLKSELQDEAQSLCDVSFTRPDMRTHYTAWNSMGTLLKKGLVQRRGCPAKFSLTEEGRNLASQLLGAQALDDKAPESKNRDLDVMQRESSSSSSVSDEIEFIEEMMPSQLYSYLNNEKEEVALKDQAMVCIRDDGKVGFLVKSTKKQLQASGKSFWIHRELSNGAVEAYLYDEDAELVSPSRKQPQSIAKSVPPSFKGFEFNSELSSSQQSAKSSESISSSQCSHIPVFVLEPGTFDVILLVDNAETSGKGAAGLKEVALDDLHRNGVDFNVRKLSVGDFAWVCKERVRPIPGQLSLPQARELVLPYIIERKRMDDLAGSIRDGRFHEQKNRMKKCGLSHCIYLVEAFVAVHWKGLGLPENTLEQAIVNTQVVDGFFVKRTKNQHETAAYLTLMTRYLQRTYSNKRLTSCSREDQRVGLVNGAQNTFLTFNEFNTHAVKTREFTVQGMFVKHLLQFHGLTAEKAKAIVEKYPTMRELLDAYRNCRSDKEKEELLQSIPYGKSGRAIGKTMSQNICKLYN